MLDINHVMFKYYDSLREDVLLIVLSLIILRDTIIGSVFAILTFVIVKPWPTIDTKIILFLKIHSLIA